MKGLGWSYQQFTHSKYQRTAKFANIGRTFDLLLSPSLDIGGEEITIWIPVKIEDCSLTKRGCMLMVRIWLIG